MFYLFKLVRDKLLKKNFWDNVLKMKPATGYKGLLKLGNQWIFLQWL